MNPFRSTRSPVAPFPSVLRWSPLMVVGALLVACSSDDPPIPCGSIPRQTLLVGQLVELQPCFDDSEGEMLIFSAHSSDVGTATVLASDSTITIRAVDAGTATVTFTAEDPAGQTASTDIEVVVVGPPRLFREDFDEGLGDWAPLFFTSASHSGGMARFHNTRPDYFGILEYRDVNVVDWVYKAALGNATENTVVGLSSRNSGRPAVYYMAVGEGSTLDSIGDADYQLIVFSGPWTTEKDWWGESDAIADVGELTELTLASWEGELTAWAGATELVKVDIAARGWPSTMQRPWLAIWPEVNTTGNEGFVDWVELWAGSSADGGWHEGPADIPELLTTGPGREIPGVEIRRK